MELRPSLLSGEPPLHGSSLGVAGTLPGGNLLLDGRAIGKSSFQALAGKHRQFNLDHIEPAPMFRCVVELQPLHETPGLRRGKDFVEGRRGMGIEVVQHDENLLGFGEVAIDERLHTAGKIWLGPSLCDFDVAPSLLRCKEHEQITRPVAPVLIIVALPFTGARRQRLSHLSDQLIRTLVKAHQRVAGVVRRGIEVQDLLHPPHELGTNRGDTPLLLQPRLDGVFFSVRPIVSSEMESTSPTSTTRSAKSCIVQRSRP